MVRERISSEGMDWAVTEHRQAITVGTTPHTPLARAGTILCMIIRFPSGQFVVATFAGWALWPSLYRNVSKVSEVVIPTSKATQYEECRPWVLPVRCVRWKQSPCQKRWDTKVNPGIARKLDGRNVLG